MFIAVAAVHADQPSQGKKKKKKKAQQEDRPAAAKPAPPDRSKLAVTDPAQLDQDFFLQGEYMGDLQGSWHGSRRIGLQVIAVGDGKFDGVLLRSGLPGAGWDREHKVTLTGERMGDSAVLVNDEFELTVTGHQATLRQRKGVTLARIRKWHRIGATLDEPPPPGAIVLFDGSGTSHFQNGKISPDGLLEVGALTKMAVGDFQLHLEFRTPYMPHARGQGRGNSGVYIQQRYEVQILDSFGLEGVDNECGGLYKQQRPAVNMCLPPLSWQTYDIFFTAARWDADGQKRTPSRITVLHNGEPIHLNYELTSKTGGGKVEGPEKLPILLQDHGNPVHFRNVWLVPSGSRASQPTCEPAPFRYQTWRWRHAWLPIWECHPAEEW
jgi:hypothetical protein